MLEVIDTEECEEYVRTRGEQGREEGPSEELTSHFSVPPSSSTGSSDGSFELDEASEQRQRLGCVVLCGIWVVGVHKQENEMLIMPLLLIF